MNAKKRYVIVGTGGRAEFYYRALTTTYMDSCELVAFCDVNQTRMNYANHLLIEKYHYQEVPTYKPDKFEEMVKTHNPDRIIITTIDRTHHTYIIKSMQLGCDVITEKPLTVDIEKCQAILDVIKSTGKQLKITFNYRYAPHNTKIKELLMNETIGKIFSVNFEWLLNRQHGADYFRRWHRDKKNSGGLLVHKSTHHFDLINFWLNTIPDTVYAIGGLNFYGKENAEKRGITKFSSRYHGSNYAMYDPFAINLEKNPHLKAMYLDAEHEDGYIRDQNVFSDGISIEDTLNALIKYKNNTIMNYSLNAYSPWEGFIVSFIGSEGRIEMRVVERPYINSGGNKDEEGALKEKSIMVFPTDEPPYEVDILPIKGGHGGGDPLLLEDLFGTPNEDPYKRSACHKDGIYSILTGIAGNISISTGKPILVKDLLDLNSL
ncbi:Gfo/Idh/MocA family oxidoreductase [Alkalihalobacillus sp. LMS39]|uniref:Gfo/Idh/MocA family protein n=1 Tax=Alkalihalobacillus sp. LMS39 TaxID=2924032 RepID=UPI001FB2AD53|nr:Gfo/Idh/MocA family oxidoreductase [Alkalihalobacillus sp. LMS39]UOE95089.1 Gfo/Idh/MocA family oxidoreductase [Alkalihalobacillus sp. LMS39]